MFLIILNYELTINYQRKYTDISDNLINCLLFVYDY
jgi:hypothetical protein